MNSEGCRARGDGERHRRGRDDPFQFMSHSLTPGRDGNKLIDGARVEQPKRTGGSWPKVCETDFLISFQTDHLFRKITECDATVCVYLIRTDRADNTKVSQSLVT